MAKITMSEALSQLPENTAETLHFIFKQNLSDDFLVDLENKKIHINFPEPEVILDIHATGAVLDPDTFVLTVNKENGEPFDVNLAKLAESEINNPTENAVVLSGNGAKESPLSADVKISEEEDNQLSKKEDGSLFVPAYQPPEQKCLAIKDVFGNDLGIRVVLCSAQDDAKNEEDELADVRYLFNNGYSSVHLDIIDYPRNEITAEFTQVGEMIARAVASPVHTVISQSNGKYTHRFTFNSGSFSGEKEMPLIATLDGEAVNKTLVLTGEADGGGFVYEG